ncbi:MAG TPA: hypothetical protein VIF57_06990 [Polyangia bacterium]|jgi:hypothetical protein
MRRAAVIAIAFALIALASTTVAAAEDDEGQVSAFEAKPTAVYAVVGFGTPVGLMGAELERTLEPHWTISASGGWGLSGFQGSAMTHFLLGDSRQSRFAIGAGISGGNYTWKESCLVDCDDPAEKTGSVMWGNLEVGGEHRFFSGFAIRYFGGYGHVVAGDLVCTSDMNSGCASLSRETGRDIIYTGVALGGAF